MNRFRDFLHNLFSRSGQSRQPGPSVGDHQPQREEPSPESRRLPETAYRKGDFIGQYYEVSDLLGMGGFGVVYKVYSHEAKDVFAVKTFRDEFLNDEKTREAFRKEAQLWVEMERHPYLVRAYYVEEISHRLYIVMEHIARGETGLNSLHEYLRSQPPDLVQSLRWAIQFCYGMEYAYAKGLRCHRDIKPSNIMIASDKTVKISDFGLAGVAENRRAIAQTPQSQEHNSAGHLNQTIPLAGTLTHMSPEQFSDMASCDQRSDIYSFGVVLYEMASGRLPFDVPPLSVLAENAWGQSEIMWKLHSEAPLPRFNSKLFPFIQHCLEKKPQRRYQTFRELRKDLEALLERTNGEKTKPPTLEELKPWEWGNKGVSLNDLGRFEEALHCHNRAIEMNPRSETAVKAWSNKALTLQALNRLDEALECCGRASKLDPAYVPNLTNKALILDDLGRYEDSVECCDRALKLEPNNSAVWNNKGKALSSVRRFADALRCHDRAVELAPRYAQAWNNKGVALKALGRFEEALVSYDRALELDSRDAMIWRNKGNILIDLLRFEKALPCFEKALEYDPSNTTALRSKAFSLVQLKRFEDAIRCYDRILEQEPKDAEIWNNKGRVLLISLYRPAEALACFENAMGIDPKLTGAWWGRATSLALKLDPDWFLEWNDQGYSLSRIGRYEGALSCFDKAIEIDQKNPAAWFNKGAALHHLGRLEEAIVVYERALELSASSYRDVWSKKALAEEKLGRLADAVHSYEKVILLCPANSDPQVQYARKRLSELKGG